LRGRKGRKRCANEGRKEGGKEGRKSRKEGRRSRKEQRKKEKKNEGGILPEAPGTGPALGRRGEWK
jgi:hypothetical protein